MKLKDLWNNGGVTIYPTDKEYAHRYLDTYDKLFAPFQNKKINIFECGYGDGGSIKLWEDYFPKANIRSIDIEKRDYVWSNGGVDFPEHSDRVRLDIINLYDLPLTYFDNFKVDIAIDDSSHLVPDQIAFIKTIWPVLNKGGLLIIEDTHDIESNKIYFDELGIPYEIIDLRDIGVYCSTLLIFRK
jgi:hypothetical protein